MPNFNLPKWPEIRVEGKSVSTKQAGEIILRTDSFLSWFGGNDVEWVKTLANLFDISYSDKYPQTNRAEIDELCKKLERINLNYIAPDRISSNYIEGLHGWIDWDGKIGCSGYNIGKWPSVEEVLNDWQDVAKGFPFLNLRCQLFSKEGGEEGGKPIVEYTVKDGVATMYEPKEEIVSDYMPNFTSFDDTTHRRNRKYIEQAYIGHMFKQTAKSLS